LEGTVSPRKNADGSVGEYFTPDTTLESRFTKAGRLPVDWEHGRAPEGEDPGVIGYVDWLTAKADAVGVFVQRVLNRRSKYVQLLEQLIAAGMIGTSSEADASAVEKAEDGRIVRWPLIADTLTVTPMEPRMLTENAMQAAKALGLFAEEPEPEAEAEDAASVAEAVKAVDVQPTITTEEETMAEDNVTLSRADLNEAIKSAALEAVKAMTPVSKGGFVVEDELDKAARDPEVQPYAHLGEQLMDVMRACRPGAKPSPRLLKAAKAPTGMSEGVPADGGFLVQTDLVAQLMRPVYETGALLSRVRRFEVSSNSNSIELFGVNETSRATGHRYGGVTGYWGAEAELKADSHPTFRKVRMELRKLYALAYATDELLQDASLVGQVIGEAARNELQFLAENAIINGTGVGQPQGILGAPCLVSQAAEALQGDTVVAENLVHMWERRWAPGNYVWLINQEVESQLMMLDLPAGGAGALVYLPPGGFSGAPYGSIFGRPVLVTEYNQELGTAGDIILADLSQYYLATKGGIQEAMSIHVHFVYDESVFRFVMRVEGQPAWSSALTPFEATTGHTVSPFVALATR
ncbi:MAG: hypothetical protein RLZZ524_586, partial [Pseudomonadota bacterium]